MGDAGPATPRRTASALLGPALALPVLAVVVVGADAARPAWSSGGAWTTPLQVVLGVVGLALVAALLVVLRNLPGGMPRADRGATRRRWWVLAAALAVGVLAWLSGVAARDPQSADADGADFGLLDGLGGQAVEPLPTTTTAVVAGLVALGLGVALATLLVRRQLSGHPGQHDTDVAATTRQPTGDARTVPDGPPQEVVLATWAIARHELAEQLGAGEHDPPGRLARRVAGTRAAAPLRVLTDIYLPVRYGRSTATDQDAAMARRALEELQTGLATIGDRR